MNKWVRIQRGSGCLQVDLVTEKEALRIEYETMKMKFSEENLSLKDQVNQLNEQMKHNQINAEGKSFLLAYLEINSVLHFEV